MRNALEYGFIDLINFMITVPSNQAVGLDAYHHHSKEVEADAPAESLLHRDRRSIPLGWVDLRMDMPFPEPPCSPQDACVRFHQQASAAQRSSRPLATAEHAVDVAITGGLVERIDEGHRQEDALHELDDADVHADPEVQFSSSLLAFCEA